MRLNHVPLDNHNQRVVLIVYEASYVYVDFREKKKHKGNKMDQVSDKVKNEIKLYNFSFITSF